MNNAELVSALLLHPYDQPVEIETMEGERLEVVGVERVGWGIRLVTRIPVENGYEHQDLFLAAVDAVDKARSALDNFKRQWVASEDD